MATRFKEPESILEIGKNTVFIDKKEKFANIVTVQMPEGAFSVYFNKEGKRQSIAGPNVAIRFDESENPKEITFEGKFSVEFHKWGWRYVFNQFIAQVKDLPGGRRSTKLFEKKDSKAGPVEGSEISAAEPRSAQLFKKADDAAMFMDGLPKTPEPMTWNMVMEKAEKLANSPEVKRELELWKALA